MKKSDTDSLLFPELPLPDNVSFCLDLDRLISNNENNCDIYEAVPEENGFTANRFLGRYMGFGYALLSDRVKNGFILSSVILQEHSTVEEWRAIERFIDKYRILPKTKISPLQDRLTHLGLLEGMSIYLHKEDTDLLYKDINIDLNKGNSNSMPSYMLGKLCGKVITKITDKHMSEEEALKMLIEEDGLDETKAKRVLYSSRESIMRVDHLKYKLGYATDALMRNMTKEQIINNLCQDGMERSIASEFVDNLIPHLKVKIRKEATKSIVFNLIVIISWIVLLYWVTNKYNIDYWFLWVYLIVGVYFVFTGMKSIYKGIKLMNHHFE